MAGRQMRLISTLTALLIVITGCTRSNESTTIAVDDLERSTPETRTVSDQTSSPGDDQTQQPFAPIPLFGELDDNVAVVAVGTYAGDGPVDVQRDASEHQTKPVEVFVDMPDRPTVLVLSAYDPVLWRIEQSADTRLVGVLVSGYHGQALTGLDADTPQFITSYVVPGDFEHYFVAHKPSADLLIANEVVQQLTGQTIDKFLSEQEDGVFAINERVIAETTIPDWGPYEITPFESLPPHPDIEQLVSDGSLRPATVEDWQTWLDKHNERYAGLGTGLNLHQLDDDARYSPSYVVLEPVTLPDGLYGAHSISLLIADGVPKPLGPEGHNDFYWLADGSTDALQFRSQYFVE